MVVDEPVEWGTQRLAVTVAERVCACVFDRLCILYFLSLSFKGCRHCWAVELGVWGLPAVKSPKMATTPRLIVLHWKCEEKRIYEHMDTELGKKKKKKAAA